MLRNIYKTAINSFLLYNGFEMSGLGIDLAAYYHYDNNLTFLMEINGSWISEDKVVKRLIEVNMSIVQLEAYCQQNNIELYCP